ncbi:MAG TPA: serine/threonine-protein kinase, partial [Terriglobales bacterium]|nr:serine/threonine-protein kinase [Terriglobales bacterium]
QFTASLRHPNIVTVYDLGEFQGTPYLVMEYLHGRSLQSLLDDQSLTMLEKVRCIRQVCEGLQYAHSRQPAIIHRDIKPANIMVVDDGIAKIIDFGIARLGQNRNTRTGFVMGTYQYMSPEQVRNQEIDGRSDVFSTGVVLFHLLTHRLPFDGTNVSQTLEMIMNSPAPPLHRMLRDYPRQLDSIVARALAKRREERYQSADEFAFDLMQVEAELKRGGFGRHLGEAERLYHQGDYERAKLELGRVLEVDAQHHEASALMTKIQRASTMQQRQKRALNLRVQAEEALKLNRVSEAFNCIEQALRLDGDNPELRSFRERILLKEKVNQALSRAERAVAGDGFEEALRAVEDALHIDPESVRAKSFKLMIEGKLDDLRPMRVRTTDGFAKPKKTRTTMSLGKRSSESKQVGMQAIGSRPREGTFENPDPVWTDDVFHTLLKPAGRGEEAPAFEPPASNREPVFSGQFDSGGSEAMTQHLGALDFYSPPKRAVMASDEPQAIGERTHRGQSEAPFFDKAEYARRTAQDAPPSRSQAWSYESLQKLENRLAAFVGPLAKVVIRKAALQARSTGDLLELVAANIKQRKDRQAFLEQNASWPADDDAVAGASHDSPHSTPVASGQSGNSISSAEMERASRTLAEYIGPLASVLSKKASKQASSVEEFYLLLSKHVKSGSERSKFLRDVGRKGAGERS